MYCTTLHPHTIPPIAPPPQAPRPMAAKGAASRLRKELVNLHKDPPPYVRVAAQGVVGIFKHLQ